MVYKIFEGVLSSSLPVSAIRQFIEVYTVLGYRSLVHEESRNALFPGPFRKRQMDLRKTSQNSQRRLRAVLASGPQVEAALHCSSSRYRYIPPLEEFEEVATVNGL